MRRWWFGLICICIFVLCPLSTSHGKTKTTKIYRVVRVIDGDTIVLNNKKYVRLIGIDAPELKQGVKFERDLQKRRLDKRTATEMGRRSKQFVKNLVEGKKVRLEFDKKRQDNYNRTLAYVYLLDGQFVNAEILKAGYAYVYKMKPDVRHASLFDKLYAEARQNKRGLWKEPKGSLQEERKYEKGFKWFDRS